MLQICELQAPYTCGDEACWEGKFEGGFCRKPTVGRRELGVWSEECSSGKQLDMITSTRWPLAIRIESVGEAAGEDLAERLCIDLE